MKWIISLIILFLLSTTVMAIAEKEVTLEDLKVNVSINNSKCIIRTPSNQIFTISTTSDFENVYTLNDFKYNLSNSDFERISGLETCPDLTIYNGSFSCAPDINTTITVPPSEVVVNINTSDIDNQNKEELVIVKSELEKVKSDVDSLLNPIEEESDINQFLSDYWIFILIIGGGLLLFYYTQIYKKNNKDDEVFEHRKEVSRQREDRVPIKHQEYVNKSSEPLLEINVDKVKPKQIYDDDLSEFQMNEGQFDKHLKRDVMEKDIQDVIRLKRELAAANTKLEEQNRVKSLEEVEADEEVENLRNSLKGI